MLFEKQHLDLFFVPLGLLVMFGYHLILLYRVLHLPYTTVIGFMNNDKKIWVDRIMQGDKSNVNMAVSVLSINTSAATFLASISLTLSSVIGALLGNSSSNNIFENKLVYGDIRSATISIKYICLLSCFVIAFACFIQSARYFVHANYLVTTPGNDIPPEIVKMTVVRGGDFWSIGLRSLYFAFNFLLWFFGPIPMFVSSIVIVILLHYLDTNSVPTPLHHQRLLGGQIGKRLVI